MSFGPVNVMPGATVTFQATPQLSFRCTRMLIGREVAPHFVIHDLRVGNDSITGMKPIPAGAFVEEAIGIAFCLDVIVGLILSMTVENTSKEARVFGASLRGAKR